MTLHIFNAPEIIAKVYIKNIPSFEYYIETLYGLKRYIIYAYILR